MWTTPLAPGHSLLFLFLCLKSGLLLGGTKECMSENLSQLFRLALLTSFAPHSFRQLLLLATTFLSLLLSRAFISWLPQLLSFAIFTVDFFLALCVFYHLKCFFIINNIIFNTNNGCHSITTLGYALSGVSALYSGINFVMQIKSFTLRSRLFKKEKTWGKKSEERGEVGGGGKSLQWSITEV